MKPVNQKSLLHFIYDQMDKLDKGEIEIDKAKAQAVLMKEANNVFKYELDRANTEMKLRDFNLRTGAAISIRDVESKQFE
jgi:hypothetical protein